MATCYGIIHKGNLIDEFTSEELENRCRRNIKIVVDKPRKAEELLKTVFNANFNVLPDGMIVLYDNLEKADKIAKEFISNEIALTALIPGEQNLESYFLDLMGGKIQ